FPIRWRPVAIARASARALPPLARPARQQRPAGSRSAERALQLVEEPLAALVGGIGRQAVELFEQPALLLRQLPGHRDPDEHALIAAPETLQNRQTATAQDAHGTGLGPGPEGQLQVAFERRHED